MIHVKRISNWYKELPKRLIIILLSIAAINYFGYIDKSLSLAGKSYLDEYNNAYIESVEKQSLKSFVVISATLSTLAVIKSASAGFSFFVDLNIGYGNLFQSLYMLVEKGWNASFIALVTIEMIKGFLIYSYKLSSVFLFGFLLSYLSEIFLTSISKRALDTLKSSKKIFLFLTLMTYVLVPIYVAGMGYVSQKISAPLNAQISQKLEALNKELVPESPEQITSNAKSYMKNIVDSLSGMKDTIANASMVLIKHSIAAILTAILIPLSFLLFVYISFKVIFRRNPN